MDAFGYLSVLLSIILGLGLTQLLTAFGRLIRQRDRVDVHWLPVLWAGVLMLIYIQVWWSMYGLRGHQHWTFFEFIIVLAQTATLYVMAAVVLPEEIDEQSADLGAYFDKHSRWFFGFFLATLVVSVAKDLVLGGALPSNENLAFHAVLAIGCILGMSMRRRRNQEMLAVGFAIVVIVYIGLLFARLR
ncbi:MAG TPA: hypothetical protein VGM67_18485 [Gemmatimonadaceae bacterium]|jgi:hypothetical protein